MEVFSCLKKIEEHGFECFLVGGYVRDFLLGMDTHDVDITTSATPEELRKIFGIEKEARYGSLSFKSGHYNIDVTTYRKESNYENRRPQRIEFIDSIEEDLKRRDFTINAICMDGEKNIYDPLNGLDDLKRKIIRPIGNVKSKFVEDPLRMLRAVRLSAVLSFEIESEALKFIETHGELIESLSYSRKKEELSKIFASCNAKRGIELLARCDLLKHLDLIYDFHYPLPDDPIGIWALMDSNRLYPYRKDEKDRIESILSIVEKGKSDLYEAVEYGIENALTACEMLGGNRDLLLEEYSKAEIQRKEDLSLDGDEIKSILGIDSGRDIKKIKEHLIEEVLSGKLSNEKKILTRYLEEKWK